MVFLSTSDVYAVRNLFTILNTGVYEACLNVVRVGGPYVREAFPAFSVEALGDTAGVVRRLAFKLRTTIVVDLRDGFPPCAVSSDVGSKGAGFSFAEG